ncbi:hypothetical protein ACFQPG_01025 [Sphingomonas sp. GCM10030256]|uniref:hypothetical protein n=1 Tax=Sphingomonas sp. GCM10030256 TaxID=3273427 RepID=UPI0036207304
MTLLLAPLLLAATAIDRPARRTASDAQMTSMDAYFGCAFGAVRAARSEGLAAGRFGEWLHRLCGAEEAELRRRSAALGRAQGLSHAAARRKADAAVDAARADMIGLYSRR